MANHALTIDLEDWHQEFYWRLTGSWPKPGEQVVATTHLLLDWLDSLEISATFFVVSSLAEYHPQLITQIAQRGHEIGSHSYNHQPIWQLTRDSFQADLIRSREQLQSLSGQEVQGFRAPEFSMVGLQHWSFEAVAAAGFRYDSSVFPLKHARYGMPDAPVQPFVLETAEGSLVEFPLATWQTGKLRWPVAGGSYFRLLPAFLLQKALRDLDSREQNAVFYFHPYQFSKGLLLLPWAAWRHGLQHRRPQFFYSLSRSILHNFATPLITKRLRLLLSNYNFVPLGTLYNANFRATLNATA